jgi:hypothetical protein
MPVRRRIAYLIAGALLAVTCGRTELDQPFDEDGGPTPGTAGSSAPGTAGSAGPGAAGSAAPGAAGSGPGGATGGGVVAGAGGRGGTGGVAGTTGRGGTGVAGTTGRGGTGGVPPTTGRGGTAATGRGGAGGPGRGGSSGTVGSGGAVGSGGMVGSGGVVGTGGRGGIAGTGVPGGRGGRGPVAGTTGTGGQPVGTIPCGQTTCLAGTQACCFLQGVATCIPAGTMCPGVSISCFDGSGCAAGDVCCISLPALQSSCVAPQICGAPGLILCSSPAHCPAEAPNCCRFGQWGACRTVACF